MLHGHAAGKRGLAEEASAWILPLAEFQIASRHVASGNDRPMRQLGRRFGVSERCCCLHLRETLGDAAGRCAPNPLFAHDLEDGVQHLHEGVAVRKSYCFDAKDGQGGPILDMSSSRTELAREI
jgi:hypothetical protein